MQVATKEDLIEAGTTAQALGSTLLFHCLTGDTLARAVKYRDTGANHSQERVKELLAMALGSMMAVDRHERNPAS